MLLFLDCPGDQAVVNIFLQRKKYYQRRDYAEDYPRKDYLPLRALAAYEAVKHCGYHRIVLTHIEIRGIEIIVDAHELDDKHSRYGGLEVREDDREIYPRIACAVNDAALVKRGGYLRKELHEYVDRDYIRANVQNDGCRKGSIKAKLVHDLENSYLHRDIRQQRREQEGRLDEPRHLAVEALDNEGRHGAGHDGAGAGDNNDYRRIAETFQYLAVYECSFEVVKHPMGGQLEGSCVCHILAVLESSEYYSGDRNEDHDTAYCQNQIREGLNDYPAPVNRLFLPDNGVSDL